VVIIFVKNAQVFSILVSQHLCILNKDNHHQLWAFNKWADYRGVFEMAFQKAICKIVRKRSVSVLLQQICSVALQM